MENIVIRSYKKEDRKAVRDIACDTAFMGEPAEVFFDDREILSDFLTRYFTDYEPESSFVAQARGEVIGYLTGAKDVLVLSRTYRSAIAPSILFKSILRGTIFSRKNFLLLFFLARSFVRREFGSPDLSKSYPATLHINIRKDFRGKDIGAKLIERYLEYLADSNIKGAHVSTLSDNAVNFFEKNGFTLIDKRERTYFKHVLGRNIRCAILGRRLLPR